MAPSSSDVEAQGELFPRDTIEWTALYAEQLARRIARLPTTTNLNALRSLQGQLAVGHTLVDQAEWWDLLPRPERPKAVAAPPEHLHWTRPARYGRFVSTRAR